ncbi:MAG: MFS transporter [Proteobacteria bacterium]|nr:MFS transporter [Pseudomonadota bacterium]
MRQAGESPLFPAISVYAGALLLGLTLVSFPGSSAYLRESRGISDLAYGSIYLSQLMTSIAGALLGGAAVQRIGLRAMYLIALIFFALSQALLALSSTVPANFTLPVLMGATGCFGFAFGFGGGPLNAFLPLLFPRRANTAIVALHMTAGAGLTLGPFVIATLTAWQHWLLAPVGLCAVALLLFAFSAGARLPAAPTFGNPSLWPAPGRSAFFWTALLMAVLYSIAEGMFSNWAILYVSEEKQLPQAALWVLTCFWGALTFGRLLTSLAVLHFKPMVLITILPLLITAAFVGVSNIQTYSSALLGFAFAGLACSGFFPLLVGTAAAPFPHEVSWIASMLTAGMMLGVGIGSYAIGALRDALSIAVLYRYSIIYPLMLLALLILLRALTRNAPAGSAIAGRS